MNITFNGLPHRERGRKSYRSTHKFSNGWKAGETREVMSESDAIEASRLLKTFSPEAIRKSFPHARGSFGFTESPHPGDQQMTVDRALALHEKRRADEAQKAADEAVQKAADNVADDGASGD